MTRFGGYNNSIMPVFARTETVVTGTVTVTVTLRVTVTVVD